MQLLTSVSWWEGDSAGQRGTGDVSLGDGSWSKIKNSISRSRSTFKGRRRGRGRRAAVAGGAGAQCKGADSRAGAVVPVSSYI